MRRNRQIAVVLVISLLATASLAAPCSEPTPVPAGATRLISAEPLQRARVDTVYLLGDPQNPDQSPQHNGTFQDAAGNPDWAGWTTWDGWAPDPEPFWQVSEFQAVAGQFSMWCGREFDGDPGYGNDWNTALQFTHTVDDPSLPVTVQWTAQLRVDSEPGYDYVRLEWFNAGVWQQLQVFDGNRILAVSETVTYEPQTYGGDDGDQVQLRVRFSSDGAWSDEDGLWQTDGACQYDDVRVVIDGVEVDFEDFEDGQSQRWIETLAQPYWDFDFARIWTDLQDVDPCVDNPSPQVAFIDTGEQSIHTDGTPCITWCYGPGGYITYNSNAWTNPSGYYLNNAIVSPALEWPAGCDAAQLDFTAYIHEELAAASPGVFVRWHVRSVDTGDPADLAHASWVSDSWMYYGGPDYRRMQHDISEMIEPGRTHLQVILHAYQIPGWWYGADGTPAPRYDNVQLKAYPRPEPVLAAPGSYLFHDAFPTSGQLDLTDLSANSVRLDASRIVSSAEPVPVDSMQVDLTLLRPDAELTALPRLVVRMLANPLFDAVRQLPAGFTQSGQVVTGAVDGVLSGGADRRCRFDLPDEGFFFPGDVLRCYVQATSEVGGQQHTAILPADTSGFGSDQRHAGYAEAFEARALPTVTSLAGDQPRVLFWQHGHRDQGQRWWLDTFAQTGRRLGCELDLYATNAPGVEDADGLGGRVPATALAGYDILVYSAGRLYPNLRRQDTWDDLELLTQWLQQGGKRLLLTGDNVMRSINSADFIAEYLDAEFDARDIAPLIGQQVSPVVVPTGDGVGWLHSLDGWLVDGGCPDIRQIDAVLPGLGADGFAEFTDPSGAPGAYPYTACWSHVHPMDDARTVTLPYDLSAVATAPGYPTPPDRSAAAALLDDILQYFGSTICAVDPVTPAVAAVRCYPNPFNPSTTVHLDLARDAAVTATVYDVRGRQVRRLVDERLAAGRHALEWNGQDQQGRQVSSGVYFVEVRAGEVRRLEKLTLVK